MKGTVTMATMSMSTRVLMYAADAHFVPTPKLSPGSAVPRVKIAAVNSEVV